MGSVGIWIDGIGVRQWVCNERISVHFFGRLLVEQEGIEKVFHLLTDDWDEKQKRLGDISFVC